MIFMQSSFFYLSLGSSFEILSIFTTYLLVFLSRYFISAFVFSPSLSQSLFRSTLPIYLLYFITLYFIYSSFTSLQSPSIFPFAFVFSFEQSSPFLFYISTSLLFLPFFQPFPPQFSFPSIFPCSIPFLPFSFQNNNLSTPTTIIS